MFSALFADKTMTYKWVEACFVAFLIRFFPILILRERYHRTSELWAFGRFEMGLDL
jgi:hypothetical protein